jgi:hypothetical protein
MPSPSPKLVYLTVKRVHGGTNTTQTVLKSKDGITIVISLPLTVKPPKLGTVYKLTEVE